MSTSALAGLLVALAAGLAFTARALHRARSALRAAAGDLTRCHQDVERCQRLLGQTDRLSALGLLAASVAHEIRNPLVSVRTFAQLLPERLHDVEFRTSFRDLALAEIDRISRLVNDLLAFARPAPPEIQETNLNDILGQICRLADGEAKKRSLTLTTELDDGLPPTPVDEGRVKQVFLNVVMNAIHACDAGGHIDIATRTIDRGGVSYFQVEVRDSGRGISPTDLGRIFDPFFTTKAGGSGLGLFIAQRIVRDHGGFVEVASTPGQGTAFYVNFPIDTGTRTAPEPTAEADADDLHHRPVTHG